MRHQAIYNLYPTVVSISGDADAYDAEGKKVLIDNSIVQKEINRLQAEYDAKEYQRLRQAAYPKIEDQLDLLYHGGYDAWKDAISKVKLQYPKDSV